MTIYRSICGVHSLNNFEVQWARSVGSCPKCVDSKAADVTQRTLIEEIRHNPIGVCLGVTLIASCVASYMLGYYLDSK